MRILGLDPSLSNFAMVVADLDLDTLLFTIESMQLVETKPDSSNKKVRKNSIDLMRCREIHTGLSSNLEGIGLVFCEMPVGSQSARAMASYGFCIGIIGCIQAPLIQMTPSEVKVAATGDKLATKEEMINWAFDKYPHRDWPKRSGKPLGKCEHMADAIAAIEAGLRTDQFKSALAMLRWVESQAGAKAA